MEICRVKADNVYKKMREVEDEGFAIVKKKEKGANSK